MSTNAVKRDKYNVVMNFRISSDLKDNTSVVLKEAGLNHSIAIRKFLEHIEKGNIPDYIKD